MRSKRMIKVLCLVAIIATLALSCAPAATPIPTKAPATKAPPTAVPPPSARVAVLFPGTIADGGWNGLAYNGLKELEDEGFDTAFTENVPQAEIPTMARGYADDGYDLILGNGWQFGTAFMELAPEFPNTKFFVMSTAPQGDIPPNLQYVFGSPHLISYATGALAALLSESGVVGFVGGGDNPAQRAIGNAFVQGAQETVDGTTALQIITGDYNDASKGREAALTMIGNGADVVWHAADITGLGVLTAGIDQGITVIGMYSDQTSMWYPSFATSVVQALDDTVYVKGHEVADGTFQGGIQWEPPFTEQYHFQAGTRTYNDAKVSAEVAAQMDQIIADLEAGNITVPYNTE